MFVKNISVDECIIEENIELCVQGAEHGFSVKSDFELKKIKKISFFSIFY
ncbi:hypothetical protein [Treponema zioleckii]|nr:hypothetical protein [Treponema zioleckii]